MIYSNSASIQQMCPYDEPKEPPGCTNQAKKTKSHEVPKKKTCAFFQYRQPIDLHVRLGTRRLCEV